MNPPTVLSRQGHLLLQVGVALLLFTSFEGLAIPYVAAPRLGLSGHTLGGLEVVLLLALGLRWPKLNLGAATSWIAFRLLIYSTFAILAAYLLASAWGAGSETIPIATGSVHGSALEETVIKIVAYSSAPTGIISFVLILWGRRLATLDG
jgi:(hydroxyamino)benzene mutase